MTKMTDGSNCPVCQERDPESIHKVSQIESDILKTTYLCVNCGTKFQVASEVSEAAPIVGIVAGIAGVGIFLRLLNDTAKTRLPGDATVNPPRPPTNPDDD